MSPPGTPAGVPDTPGSSRAADSSTASAVCFETDAPEDADHDRRRVTLHPDRETWNAIEVSEPDGRAYDDELTEGVSPGSGAKGDDCGDEISALFCGDCGEPVSVGRTCRRSRCPRCWQSWAFQRAVEPVAKTQSLAKTWGAQSGRSVKKHHLTVSLAGIGFRVNAKDPLDRGFQVVKRLMRQISVDTGTIIYHPWRITEEYRGEVKGHESGDGDMTWADVLGKVESDDWTWEAVRDEFLVYAPHFHVIAVSDWVEGGAVTREIEEQTGVVVERITEADPDSSTSIRDLVALARATLYAVSHTGLRLGDDGAFRSAIRQFGEVANFEAYDDVRAEATAALRSAAPDVLGVEFPEPRCSAPVEDADADAHDHADADAEPRDPATPETPAAVRVASGSGVTATGRAPDDLGPRATWNGSDDAPAPAGELDATEAEAWDASAQSRAWDVPAGSDHRPAFVDDPTGASSGDESEADAESTSTSAPRCRGQLRPMWEADEYLGDESWVEARDDATLDALREAREEWEELGRPRPAQIPEDPPPVESPPAD
ncbi:hypothetical protein [Halorussus marinus]|uniref:hypothetical protein n=1 Tax=Halorussus marinus TaxID=2505976 RepID=UPI0010927357|nr:hypothetical protein [Halorussus marinus]